MQISLKYSIRNFLKKSGNNVYLYDLHFVENFES